MPFTCLYCNKDYSSKSNLKNHQKSAKYCLEIQKNNNLSSSELDSEHNSFVCNYCQKDFSSNHRYQKHQDICLMKHKHIILSKETEIANIKEQLKEKDAEIEEYKQKMKTIRLEVENQFYKQREERSTNVVEEIAKQPRITTNNNQKVLISTPLDLSQQVFQQAIHSGFSEEYLIQGQRGAARFAVDNILKDEEGKLKYICTDASRQIFQYKNEDGTIQKDVRATKLTKALLDGDIKQASHKIACKKMDGSDEAFESYTSNYYEIKELENDNSEFSKELSSLTI
jgi:hypothetical protein